MKIKFLKRLSRCFAIFLNRHKNIEIEPDDALARFIFDKKKMTMNVDGRRLVKFRAFMPRAQETSISSFVVTDLCEIDKWKLAKPRQGRGVKGRAEIAVQDVESVKPLRVFRDDEPRFHANICCWPTDDSKHKAIAIDLATKATFIEK